MPEDTISSKIFWKSFLRDKFFALGYGTPKFRSWLSGVETCVGMSASEGWNSRPCEAGERPPLSSKHSFERDSRVVKRRNAPFRAEITDFVETRLKTHLVSFFLRNGSLPIDRLGKKDV